LKATIPSQGNLMNYLVSVVEAHPAYASKILLSFLELSPAILATADLPAYRQLISDLNSLETQFNKMKMEFEKIKEGKENVGLDGEKEDRKGKTIAPLLSRLSSFLQKSTPVLQEMKSLQRKTEEMLLKSLAFYGESVKGGLVRGGSEEGWFRFLFSFVLCVTSVVRLMSFSFFSFFSFTCVSSYVGEDVVKKFFGMILEFARLFQVSVEENKQKRLLQEKQQQHEEKNYPQGAAAASSSSSSTSPVPPAAKDGKGAASSDIFGQFHKAQKASNDQLLEEFKNKLKNKFK
jgi:hypothetical protein